MSISTRIADATTVPFRFGFCGQKYQKAPMNRLPANAISVMAHSGIMTV